MSKKAPNEYKVPKNQWNKWSDLARWMFNDMYWTIKHNQHVFQHPKTQSLPKQQWNTIAWNVAWESASQLDEYIGVR